MDIVDILPQTDYRWALDLRNGEISMTRSFPGGVCAQLVPLERWLDHIHQADRADLHAALTTAVVGGTALEHEYRLADEPERWVLCRGVLHGELFYGSAMDITSLKQRIIAAQHDTLTRLPRRVLFEQRLAQALLQLRHEECNHFAVLFLDVDDFKLIDDGYGHLVGDAVLYEVAQRLRRSVRPTDLVARWGGDEFVIFLEDVCDVGNLTAILTRIRSQVAQPMQVDSAAFTLGISIGLAVSTDGYDCADAMLDAADTELYKEKQEKKGQLRARAA